MSVFLCAGAPAVFAQAHDPYAIRVESNLVQVHVEVAHKKEMHNPPPSARFCGSAVLQQFHSLPLTEPYLPADCSDWMLHDLSAADFHVFEDGSEQKIQSAIVEPVSVITARDNMGWHDEWSHTPKGKWSTRYAATLVNQTFHYYSLAYVPPRLAAGKCHSVLVTVSRPDTIVFAPTQYCYVPHPATDPLLGTDFGKRLETELESKRKPGIPLAIEAAFVYSDAHQPRVDVVLQFPWSRLKHSCTSDGDVKSDVAVLGVAYAIDHSPVLRFSDSDSAGVVAGPHLSVVDCSAQARLPSHYETQIDLPPGHYELRVVLSDGEKFGRADVPITIDDYDGKQLGLSSAILFKRFRNASAAAKEAAYVNLAPEYVPLVSRDQQITPTADPSFSRKELVPVYFEVYDPFLADQPTITVRARARMVSVKTGEIRNFNWFDAAEFRRPGSTTFAIAKEFDPSGLPKGEYRLEVQASDSAGHTTPWRSTTLTLH